MKSIDWKKLIVAVTVCEGAGILGSIVTFPAIPTWFATLVKPSFSPPNWVFGPVWTTLYFLMGVSLYRVWMRSVKKLLVREAIFYFFVQLFLNVVWSFVFFGQKNIGNALVDIAFLWVAIALTIRKFYHIDRWATYLLVPYFLWVSFAMYLNYSLFLLNR